jgi:putative iron-dependent peroxidase
MLAQPGILAPVPSFARHLLLRCPEDPAVGRSGLGRVAIDLDVVVGLGPSLAGGIAGMRPFPALAGPGVAIPSTPFDAWLWLRGEDRGELVHRTRHLLETLEAAFEVEDVVDAFRWREGRDLTGYEDGTENPVGDAAVFAAVVGGRGAGLDGSSFAALQRWEHDLDAFEDRSPGARDRVIGRRIADNVEIADAPPSAHVKRTAQESFSPPAFLVRRSMPWADPDGEGLMFLAFGASLDAYEAQLRRMLGLEDGIVDALFSFTHPRTGSTFWCPPVRDGRLDLRAVGG